MIAPCPNCERLREALESVLVADKAGGLHAPECIGVHGYRCKAWCIDVQDALSQPPAAIETIGAIEPGQPIDGKFKCPSEPDPERKGSHKLGANSEPCQWGGCPECVMKTEEKSAWSKLRSDVRPRGGECCPAAGMSGWCELYRGHPGPHGRMGPNNWLAFPGEPEPPVEHWTRQEIEMAANSAALVYMSVWGANIWAAFWSSLTAQRERG